MSKSLNKRIFATVLTPAVALTSVQITAMASEKTVAVEADQSFEIKLNEEDEVAGAAKIGEQVFNTIKEAIDAAQDGDTVTINSGVYDEPIVLGNKRIVLEGTGEHETVLTGGITFEDDSYDGAKITIRNLKFKQKGIQFKVGADKDLSKIESFVIEDNKFENAANGASMYSIYFVNTNNAMNGLVIRNNDFSFAEDTGTFLGGICAAVCGKAEITGNTFNHMPFNAMTIYGVETAGNGDKVEHLTISGNTFNEWGFNTETGEGRAMRLSGVAGEVDLTNNKFVCTNMPEEIIKITGNEGNIDMSKCYWNGEEAIAPGFVSNEQEVTDVCQVICDGTWKMNNYFMKDTMNAPEDLKNEAQIGDEVYSSIQLAIADAKDGDTVKISSGTFEQPVVLDSKSIILEGTGNHETVLTGGLTFKNEAYEGSNITIRNLKFEQKGIQFKIDHTNDLSKMTALTIENNKFKNAANGASMYSLYIVNTNNAMNGLTVRNNEFMFDAGTGTFLGGICAALCGTAEITGNTFTNMPFNAMTLYGVETAGNGDKMQKLTLTHNTFNEWGFNTETGEGRAIRMSGMAGDVDMTNNKYVCKNMPEEIIKITDNVGCIDLSKCYWNGEDATTEGFIFDGKDEMTDACKVICDGDVILENYFIASTMRDPQDLNTYEAPIFNDTTNHWATKDINFVVERGLFNGTSEKTFSPNANMTRGSFTVVLGRLQDVDVSHYTESSFTDIKASDYFMKYVEWASENKLVNGTGNGKFSPNQGITREQLAVMLTNYAKAFGYEFPANNDEKAFADQNKVSSWAKQAVANMQISGVMNGKSGNKFEPQAIATRAEVAAVVKRFVELVIE